MSALLLEIAGGVVIALAFLVPLFAGAGMFRVLLLGGSMQVFVLTLAAWIGSSR